MGRLRFFESLKYVLWEGNFKGAVVQWEIVVLAGLADPPSSGRREGRIPVVAHSSIYPLCLSHFAASLTALSLPLNSDWPTDWLVLDLEPPDQTIPQIWAFHPWTKNQVLFKYPKIAHTKRLAFWKLLDFCLAWLQPSDFSQYWLSSLL